MQYALIQVHILVYTGRLAGGDAVDLANLTGVRGKGYAVRRARRSATTTTAGWDRYISVSPFSFPSLGVDE